jgi:hypothetical protein
LYLTPKLEASLPFEGEHGVRPYELAGEDVGDLEVRRKPD